MRHYRFVTVALVAVGCDLAHDVSGAKPTSIAAVSISPNPNMVTAAFATVECTGELVAVQISYRAGTLDSGQTPRIAAPSCPVTVPLLGLLPSSNYATQVTMWGRGGDSVTVGGPTVPTGSLPADLPLATTRFLGPPSRGLTALSVFEIAQALTRGYAVVVDSAGRIRWYVRANRLIVDFQPQPGNRYTLCLTNYDPLSFGVLSYADGQYQELDLAGGLLRKWTPTGGYFADNHEIRFTSPGTALLMGFDFRSVDLTAFGGPPAADVLGNVLEEVDSLGRVLFFWSAFDHYAVTDIDPLIPLTTQRVDWNHSNAIEIDRDGNYLISVRHFSEVTKINSRTGAVIWRFGGARNQSRFESDTERFSFQHGVRRLANGNLILFDNGNGRAPPFRRAVEHQVHEPTNRHLVRSETEQGST